MASNVRVGIQFVVDQAAFRAQLDQVKRAMGTLFSDVTVNDKGVLQGFQRIREAAQQTGQVASSSARQSSQQSQKSHQDTARVAQLAAEAIAAQEKRLADVKAKYSAAAYMKGASNAKNLAKAEEAATNAILADIKALQDKRAAIQTAITATENAEVKKRLQAQNKALLDETKLLKQAALDKDAVSRGGAGGKVGLLGTGRQIVGDQLGGNLGGVIGGVSGKAAVASAGIGIAVGLAKEGIAIFADFETSMADLSAITGLTGKKLEEAGNDARELGLKFGIDGKEGVESMKLVISALGPGVAQNQEVLKGMTDTVLTFAKAGSIDGQAAADALTVTMSQYGYATADAATQLQVMNRIANVQAAASKEGSAEIQDLAASMKVVGATANNAGISIEQTASWLEQLAPAGIKGAEAGTAFRNVILKMSAGSKEGTKALQAMGLTYDQINPKKVGMTKAMETLQQGFTKLHNPVDRAAALQKIFGMENANAATVLMNSAKQVDNFTEKITGTATAQEMAAVKMETMKEGFNRFMAQVKDLAITIFDALKPALDLIVQGIGYLATGLKYVIGWIVDGVKWIVNFSVGVYRVVYAIGKWISQTGIFKASLGVARSVVDAVSDAIGTLIGWVSSAWNWIKNLATGFYEWLKSIAPIRAAMEGVSAAIGWVVDKAKEAWGWIQKVAGWTGAVGDDEAPAASTTTPGGAAAMVTGMGGQNPASPKIDVGTAGDVEAGSDEHLIQGGRGRGGGKPGGGQSASEKAKDAFDAEVLAKEGEYNATLHELSLQRRNNLLTEEQLAVKDAEAKIALNNKKIELAKRYNQDVVGITRDGELLLLDLRDAQYNEEKSRLERQTTERLEIIEQSFLEGKINEDHAKAEKVRAEQAHNNSLIELGKKYNQDTLTEQRKALKLSIELGKANLADAFAVLQKKRDDAIEILTEQLETEQITEAEFNKKKISLLSDFTREAAAVVAQHGVDVSEVNREIATSEKDLTKTKQAEEKLRRDAIKKTEAEEDKRMEDFRKNNLVYRVSFGLLTSSITTGLAALDDVWQKSFKNQSTVLFQVLNIMSGTVKEYLGEIAKEYADKIAVIVGENLAAAGSYMVSAVGSLIAWQASLGWWNLLLIPGEIAALYGMFEGAKKLFGFEQGGYTGDGRSNEVAGVVHRGEVVMPASVVRQPGMQQFLLGLIERGSQEMGGANSPLLSRYFVGESGEIGREKAPQLTQAIMPSLPVPTSRSGRDETMADVSAAVRELRQEFRRRPSPIIMDQRGNILSMEQERERMRRERL